MWKWYREMHKVFEDLHTCFVLFGGEDGNKENAESAWKKRN